MATRIAIGRRRARRRGASVQKNGLRDQTPKDGEHVARALITNVGSEGDGAGRGGLPVGVEGLQGVGQAAGRRRWRNGVLSKLKPERLTLPWTAGDGRVSACPVRPGRSGGAKNGRCVAVLSLGALAGPFPN